MKNLCSLTYSFLSAVPVLIVIGCGTNNDVDIRISETKDELVVSASYPEKESKRVQDYVRSKLKMTDISDLRYLEIKKYQAPGQNMNFHIRSRDGYLKIVLDRSKNTYQSYKALKETGQGLGKLLAQQ